LNNADNRILTATGTQGEANAEANLTFDGSTLKVTGDTQVVGENYLSSSSESGVNSSKTVLSISSTSSSMATFDYFVSDGTNFRGGTVIMSWLGSTVAYTDYSADYGDTTALTWSGSVSGGNLLLQVNITSGTWTIKVGARLTY
jgi:hypothetical protein